MIPNQPIWTLIDQRGVARSVSPAYTRTRRALSARQTAWPAFSQLIVAAPADQISAALDTSLRELEHSADAAEQGAPALRYASCGALTLIAEPGEDMGLRSVCPALADALMEALGADGALVSQDEEGTLYLAMYSAGELELCWLDPLIQGQGSACTYHPDGRCTEEDPRHFALRALQLDEDTAELDRYAFIELMLQRIGLPRVYPDLVGLDSAALLLQR